jgi:hypothetical protein
MQGSWRRVLSAALLLSNLYGAFAVAAAGVQEDLAVVPEGVLRRLAKKTVLPDYNRAPANSSRAVLKPRARLPRRGNLLRT